MEWRMENGVCLERVQNGEPFPFELLLNSLDIEFGLKDKVLTLKLESRSK